MLMSIDKLIEKEYNKSPKGLERKGIIVLIVYGVLVIVATILMEVYSAYRIVLPIHVILSIPILLIYYRIAKVCAIIERQNSSR